MSTARPPRKTPYLDPDTRWINSAQYPPPPVRQAANRIRYPHPNRLGLTTQR